MSEQPAIPILWRGPETVEEVLSRLRPGTDIELQLAGEYHHALFRVLYPDAAPGQPEELDCAGGAELLQPMAGISGLEGIAGLIAPLRQARARVHVIGRARIAIMLPDG